MADKKISELVSITGSATAADDYFVVVDTSGAVTYKISREELNNAIEQDVLSSIEITDITNDVNVQGTVTADGLTVDGKATIDQGALGGNTLSLDRTGADGTLGLFNNGTQTGLISAVSGGGINAYVGSTPSLAMSISSTSNVGIGTASPNSFYSLADNLVVGTGSGGNGMTIYSGSADSGYIGFNDTASASMQGFIQYNHNGDYMAFAPNGTEKMRIDGATGNVLIGDSAPQVTSKLTVSGNGSADTGTFMYDGAAGTYFDINTNAANGTVDLEANARTGAFPPLTFKTGGSERLRIDSSGNVGIGTGSPSELLHIRNASGDAAVRIQGNTRTFNIQQNNYGLRFVDVDAGSAERMRIDSNGNVCIGNTVANVVSAYNNQPGGGYIRTDSHWEFGTTSNRAAVEIGKNNANDGDIVAIRKQGATVGSISVIGGKLTINSYGSNLSYATGSVVRMNNDASQFYVNTDNSMNLGIGHLRWNTLFASNGTINTSDTNEKQQIAALTEAEMTAAKAISQLFKTFKWNDSVAEKGDAARTHTGVIAQDVQAAMSAAGLNAANYAFWCSDTWWETQTEVPAVEADEENGIEAVAAYTRTDTFKTVEEAPEGAAERTRLGIRYPELLAFIGAATEQRLSNIETRLAALETN
jgi:hypothetical protein